jgi:putative ABC transport system permease protein
MLFDLAIKTLWRHKLRSLLTILGVAIAVQTYLMINGIMVFYERDSQRLVSLFAGKVYVQQVVQGVGAGKDFPSFDSSIGESKAETLLALDGINREASSAALFIPLVPSVAPNMPPTFLAAGVEPGSEAALLGGLEAESGSLELEGSNSVILGANAAKRYTVPGSGQPAKAGETVLIRDREFIVAGLLKPVSALYDGAVILPLATAQDLFNRTGTVSSVILTASRLENIEGIKTAVLERFPTLDASNPEDIAQNASDMMAMQRMFMDMISSSTILATAMMIMIVVMVAVMEQRRDIGTLRAVGAKRWRILGMVLFESLLLSIIGGILAIPVSLLAGGALNYGVNLSVMENISLWLVTIGACTLVGLAASLLPVWQAVRVDPLEALQYQ